MQSHYRRSFSIRRSFLLLLLFVFIPILMFQSWTYYDRYQGRRDLTLQANLEVSRVVAQSFDALVKEVFRQELFIGAAVSAFNPLTADRVQAFLDVGTGERSAIWDLAWVTPEGYVMASTDRDSTGGNIGAMPYFLEILAGHDQVVSDLLVSARRARPIFTISRGIRDGKGSLLGIVVATIAPERLDEMFSARRKQGGAISIIDRQGRLVYRHPNLDLSWEERDRLARYPVLDQALGGKEVVATIFSNLQDSKRMVAFCPIGGYGWVAGASCAERKAMAPVVSRLALHGVLFFCVACAALLIATLISHRIARPIRKLRDQSILLGRGELEHPVGIEGPAELQDLASTFNVMAEGIRLREHALLEAKSELESRVEERTADLEAVNVALRAEVAERMKAQNALKRAHDELEVRVLERTAELAGANEELRIEVSERRRAEEALRSRAEQLKLFAYSIAHDLKSPAIGLHGLTNLLRKQYGEGLDARGRTYCDQIVKASEHIAALVEKINAYAAAKEAPLTFDRVDVKELLKTIHDEFDSRLAARHVEWHESCLPVEIKADALSMLRVFRNLVDNALKYGGGQLSAIQIEHGQENGYHTFSVCDNGVGVAGKDAERIFGHFQRSGKTNGVEGLGLGLSIVKEIIEKHGGKVWAEPGTPGGVTFRFSISKNL